MFRLFPAQQRINTHHRVQESVVTDEELRILIEDIRKSMREELEDFETNQHVIGMKHLFRGLSTKA